VKLLTPAEVVRQELALECGVVLSFANRAFEEDELMAGTRQVFCGYKHQTPRSREPRTTWSVLVRRVARQPGRHFQRWPSRGESGDIAMAGVDDQDGTFERAETR
jgi:hypothetical protein